MVKRRTRRIVAGWWYSWRRSPLPWYYLQNLTLPEVAAGVRRARPPARCCRPPCTTSPCRGSAGRPCGGGTGWLLPPTGRQGRLQGWLWLAAPGAALAPGCWPAASKHRRHRLRRPVRGRRGGAVRALLALFVALPVGKEPASAPSSTRPGQPFAGGAGRTRWVASASGACRAWSGVRCGVAWNTLFLALPPRPAPPVMGTLIALLAERGSRRLAVR